MAAKVWLPIVGAMKSAERWAVVQALIQVSLFSPFASIIWAKDWLNNKIDYTVANILILNFTSYLLFYHKS